MVPHWLNEEPNRTRILSFNHATPSDGGTGALYVLLKRKREGHTQ
jgi:DNA-nicking Smr family endonuclease